MSLYKPKTPILEIRVEDTKGSITDWYGNLLWINLDRERKHHRQIHGYKYRVGYGGLYSVSIDIPTACKAAKVARLKLTKSRQRCKIFMKYGRPYVSL